MAILENETQNYYKIHFDECMIKGYGIYVVCSAYKTTADREKEKTRESLIVAFLNKIQDRIHELYQSILLELSSLGKQPNEIMDEQGQILEEYPNLLAMQREMNMLEPYPHKLASLFYVNNTDEENDLQGIDFETLKQYGFMEEWLSDPINIQIKFEVYCGEYNGEAINHEFYYNKLKTTMSENIQNI